MFPCSSSCPATDSRRLSPRVRSSGKNSGAYIFRSFYGTWSSSPYTSLHTVWPEAIVPTDMLKHAAKIILGISVTPLGGASWFLITLMQSLILYKLLLAATPGSPNRPWLFVLPVALAAGVAGMLIELPWGLSKALVALSFICAGHMAKRENLTGRCSSRYHLLAVLAGVLIVCLCSRFNHPDMAFHRYGIIPLFWLSALAGSYAMFPRHLPLKDRIACLSGNEGAENPLDSNRAHDGFQDRVCLSGRIPRPVLGCDVCSPL